MPALKLFGRKWLVASDDLVFPGLFELVFRFLWMVLMALVCSRYYLYSWDCSVGGELVRAYLAGMLGLLVIIMVVLVPLVNRSAQGTIMDTAARKHVPLILVIKILLIIPEIVWNIMGTIWIFSDVVQCGKENFTTIVIEGLVIFNWVLLALALLGFALVFDPLGTKYNNLDTPVEAIRHRKVTNLWVRRFQWLCCWIRKDTQSHEAFQHIAALFSGLFRSTDAAPSDFLAGFVLLRVKQKREVREERQQLLLANQKPRYTSDIEELFTDTPPWMTLENARHFLRFSIAAYGWPFVMYQWPFSGLFRLIRNMTCCSCFRSKYTIISGDNCCLCNLAGVKHISKLSADDILYASFENEVFQSPFFVVADHETSSIVIVIRGSISLRDIFTDLTAGADEFVAEGIPPNSMAHRGMKLGALHIKAQLEETGILEKAFHIYPDYGLVITGHSLGSGVSVLLALLLRPKYSDLKVYCASPPAAVLSREAARVTEEFTFSFGLGDDFVMRLSVDSFENLRTNLLHVIKSCRLPKYRVMLNAFGYALFGVPVSDLDTIWKSDTHMPSTAVGNLPLLLSSTQSSSLSDISVLAKDWSVRRFSHTRLYNPGRILHITRRKRTKSKKPGGVKYDLRWAIPEEFMEMSVMPHMLLDHLPENVDGALKTILEDKREVYKRHSSVTQI